MLERLASASKSSAGTLPGILEGWAEDAFRTMVFAAKVVDEKSFTAWQKKYLPAASNPAQKALKAAGLPNEIDRLSDVMESKLTLQASTGGGGSSTPTAPLSSPSPSANCRSNTVTNHQLHSDQALTATLTNYQLPLLPVTDT